jgi:prepilin-type N-terminal cleavage/methylation domain-containing protein
VNINIRSCFYNKTEINRNKLLTTGFTIIELMIASTVFAVILLVVAIGAISLTDSYYKGITSSDVQSVARAIMSEVSQSIEFSANLYILPTTSSDAVAGYCIDNTLYSYELGLEVVNPPTASQDQNYHALVVSNNASCSSSTILSLPTTAAPLPITSHELLNQYMRLTAFDITQLPNYLYKVHIKILYGDNNILNPTPTTSSPVLGSPSWSTEGCATGTGSQFCAVSEFTTTVEQRLN